MAIQSQVLSSTILPGVRPRRSMQTPRPLALHPALLMREVAGDAPGVESLPVRGSAMRDAMVEEGDVILLQQCSDVADGELAAVYLAGNHDLRLRRVHGQAGRLRLEPENRSHPGEILPAEQVEIRGRVIAIMRQPRA
jgi:SOS-response transcriptional repressor LexA